MSERLNYMGEFPEDRDTVFDEALAEKQESRYLESAPEASETPEAKLQVIRSISRAISANRAQELDPDQHAWLTEEAA